MMKKGETAVKPTNNRVVWVSDWHTLQKKSGDKAGDETGQSWKNDRTALAIFVAQN
jgi:hypothetical protein